MIPKLTFVILLFFAFSGFSQEIRYSLFLKDPCSNTLEKSFSYYLEKDGKKYTSDFDFTPIILPTLGKKINAQQGIQVFGPSLNIQVSHTFIILTATR